MYVGQVDYVGYQFFQVVVLVEVLVIIGNVVCMQYLQQGWYCGWFDGEMEVNFGVVFVFIEVVQCIVFGQWYGQCVVYQWYQYCYVIVQIDVGIVFIVQCFVQYFGLVFGSFLVWLLVSLCGEVDVFYCFVQYVVEVVVYEMWVEWCVVFGCRGGFWQCWFQWQFWVGGFVGCWCWQCGGGGFNVIVCVSIGMCQLGEVVYLLVVWNVLGQCMYCWKIFFYFGCQLWQCSWYFIVIDVYIGMCVQCLQVIQQWCQLCFVEVGQIIRGDLQCVFGMGQVDVQQVCIFGMLFVFVLCSGCFLGFVFVQFLVQLVLVFYMDCVV